MTVKAVDSVTIIDLTDIAAVKTWYLAKSRTAAAPTVATNATEAQMTSAGWGTMEPGVDTTKKLYTVQQNIFGDGTYVWGSVSLSSSYEAAIQAYNLANTASGTAATALAQSVEYIVGTQTASTNAWTGVTTDAALNVGKTIAYKLPYAGTSTAATLNLTLSGGGTTGAKNIRWNSGSTVTTHYGAGAVINMTWDGSYWRISEYNSDTTNRLRCQNVIKAAAAIAAEQVICGTASGYKPVAAGTTFDISYPLLIAGSAISSGSTGDNNFFSRNGVTPKNGTTAVTGLTQYATVYLKGTLSGKTFTIVSPVYTTTAPTSADGYVYKPVGQAYSTTAMYFSGGLDKSIYAFRNGQFQEIDTVSRYITYVDATHGIRVHNENDTSNYSQINSGGMQVYQSGDEVASFGGSVVNLGKNSPESVIKMCYEKMAVAARYGELTDIYSNNADYDTTLDFDFNLATFSTKVNHAYGLYEFIYESSDGWTLNTVVGNDDVTYSNVNLAQYGITMHTASINDYASIYITYYQGSHIKLTNTDTQMPSRKLELELAEGASTSDSDYANITIERQTQEYESGDTNEHSIITMMTVHDQANVATLQLFDDEISIDAGHMYFNGGNAEFSDNIIDGYGNSLSGLANLIKPASLTLGSLVTAGILTSSSGALSFSIPTGRSYPSGTTINRLTFTIVARAGNKNGTGMYIVKSTSGGSSGASFTKGSAFSFYNGANASKSLAASKVTVSLYGGTNIYVSMASGTDYFFSGNSTNNGYVNNQPVVILLASIQVGFTLP